MPKKHVHILLISDIHLLSEICNERALLKVFEEYSYDELIIVGDLHEREGKLTDGQFEIVKHLRENRDKVVYIDGNHDRGEKTSIGRLIDIEPVKKHIWQLAGRKFCAIHGDKFDRWCWIFGQHEVDRLFNHLVSFAKRFNVPLVQNTGLFDCMHNWITSHFRRQAIKFARKKGFDAIICGHTHHAQYRPPNGKGKSVEYVNCGAFVLDNPCSWITIDQNGTIEIHSEKA